MYRYTLKDARNSGPLKAISGVCSTSTQFSDLVNEAQRRLSRRGDWFDTDFTVNFCLSGCIIAWPRWVGGIRGIKAGGRKPAHVFNHYYSFIGPHKRGCDFKSDVVVEDINPGPCTNEISGTTGKLLRYYVVHQSDIGKKIRVFGTQYGGQPLQEQDANGNWVNGMTITAAMPYGSSPTYVTGISSITRDETDGMSYLYEYDPTANTLRDLAAYDPSETNPRYRRSTIIGNGLKCGPPDSNGIFWQNMEVLLKVEFVPVEKENDFLMIDNFDAMKFMIQAIKAEEANDDKTAEIKIAKAIRELNFELRDKNPDDQTAIRVSPVMGCKIKNPI